MMSGTTEQEFSPSRMRIVCGAVDAGGHRLMRPTPWSECEWHHGPDEHTRYRVHGDGRIEMLVDY
jgi:hypothetical protein